MRCVPKLDHVMFSTDTDLLFLAFGPLVALVAARRRLKLELHINLTLHLPIRVAPSGDTLSQSLSQNRCRLSSEHIARGARCIDSVAKVAKNHRSPPQLLM